jgi:hypothetical protein
LLNSGLYVSASSASCRRRSVSFDWYTRSVLSLKTSGSASGLLFFAVS